MLGIHGARCGWVKRRSNSQRPIRRPLGTRWCGGGAVVAGVSVKCQSSSQTVLFSNDLWIALGRCKPENPSAGTDECSDRESVGMRNVAGRHRDWWLGRLPNGIAGDGSFLSSGGKADGTGRLVVRGHPVDWRHQLLSAEFRQDLSAQELDVVEPTVETKARVKDQVIHPDALEPAGLVHNLVRCSSDQ